jgi:hypothetical protein
MIIKVRFVLFLTIISFVASPQSGRNVVSVNAIGVLSFSYPKKACFFNLKYERVLNNKFSLIADLNSQPYFFYGLYSSGIIPVTELDIRGTGLSVEGRFYPLNKTKSSPKGFFIGTYLKSIRIHDSYFKTDYVDTFSIDEHKLIHGVGFNIGYKFGKKNFLIEPLLGIGTCYFNHLSSKQIPLEHLGSAPYWFCMSKIECNLGFRF